jgi:hypothetical protein
MTDPSPPPSSDPSARRARWVAIVTGAVSILIAVLYLLFVMLLDLRGPLLPPPPEALGAVLQAGMDVGPAGGAGGVPAGVAAVRPRG